MQMSKVPLAVLTQGEAIIMGSPTRFKVAVHILHESDISAERRWFYSESVDEPTQSKQ